MGDASTNHTLHLNGLGIQTHKSVKNKKVKYKIAIARCSHLIRIEVSIFSQKL